MRFNKNSKSLLNEHQSGMTLIEVLVSMLLLAIGMLGIAGLQAATSKYNINTAARSEIAVLLSDFADNVRANPDAAGNNFVTSFASASEYAIASDWATQKSDLLTISKNCLLISCTSSERATYDMLSWRTKVRASAPQGASWVTGNRSDGFNVTLMWFDKEFTNKRQTTNDGTTANAVALNQSNICDGTETGLLKQNCCPADAKVPVGVRCNTLSFIP
jgi:type IV pilus assembly protein PilV